MTSAGNRNKILLLFCDGAGQDDIIASMPNVAAQVPIDAASPARYATNALKLSRAIMPRSQDGRLQLVFYQRAVSSEICSSADRDCYAFIAQNYDEGDEICLFGFTRGAYIVRKVAGLEKVGLLQHTSLGHFFHVWKALMKGADLYILPDTSPWGIWYTGGAVIAPGGNDLLSIKDANLPACIDCALHGFSFQENGEISPPTLWMVPDEGLAVTHNGETQVFKQIWFPGAHSDVGGEYPTRAPSDLALLWMVGEISSFINLDLPSLQQTIPAHGDGHAWGDASPHNASIGLPDLNLIYGINAPEPCLQSKQTSAEDAPHASPAQASPAPPEINTEGMALPKVDTLHGKSVDGTNTSISTQHAAGNDSQKRPLYVRRKFPAGSLSTDRRRWKKRYQAVLQDLQAWRREYWLESDRLCATPESLMPDRILNALAQRVGIKTLEHVKYTCSGWDSVDTMGPLALARIEAFEKKWNTENKAEIKARKTERMGETARQKACAASEYKAKVQAQKAQKKKGTARRNAGPAFESKAEAQARKAKKKEETALRQAHARLKYNAQRREARRAKNRDFILYAPSVEPSPNANSSAPMARPSTPNSLTRSVSPIPSASVREWEMVQPGPSNPAGQSTTDPVAPTSSYTSRPLKFIGWTPSLLKPSGPRRVPSPRPIQPSLSATNLIPSASGTFFVGCWRSTCTGTGSLSPEPTET
ncbi:hypothetical protein BDW22DRAFT_1488076 [Trametopsis cervina]|nr:hypothetical protein BDW22DRAFT_1488076 [Trametopsis cervina]